MKPGDSLPDPTLSTAHTSRGPAGSPPTQLLAPLAFSVTSDLAGPLLPETPCPLSLRHPHLVPSPRPSRPPLLQDQPGPWLPAGALRSSPRPAHLSQPVDCRPQTNACRTNEGANGWCEEGAGVSSWPGLLSEPHVFLQPLFWYCHPRLASSSVSGPVSLPPGGSGSPRHPRRPPPPSALSLPVQSHRAVPLLPRPPQSSRPHGPLLLLQPCRLPRSSAVRERRRG